MTRSPHLRRCSALGALVLACGACGAADDAIGTGSENQTEGQTLPLREVSGLAERDHRFVAVGDRASTVVTFRLENGALADVVSHEPLPKPGRQGSQYEAVTIDGEDNVVVLSEAGDLVVLSPDCEREVAAAKLDWASVNPLVDGRVELNSLGEGLVVLDATHVVVALEKSPPALVEFGPPGDAPIGYAPDRARAKFAPPSELVALAAWKVDDAHAPDLSELLVGPDGALWALSQKAGTILRFERTLRPDEARATIKEHVRLPGSIAGAEGLAFDGARPVVARDRSGVKQNLFVLESIPSLAE